MSISTKLTGKKLESFLRNLSTLVDTLPSEETKSQLDLELQALIKFLQDFQVRLRSLPSEQDAEGVSSTIETLKDYVRIAESDPVMSRVLGLTMDSRTLRKPSRNYLSDQDRKEAIAVAEELKDLSPADIEHKFEDKRKYNITMLKQIGKELGLSIPSKSTRLSIIEKITKKTANLRGYNYLRYGRDQSVGGYVSEPEEKSR